MSCSWLWLNPLDLHVKKSYLKAWMGFTYNEQMSCSIWLRSWRCGCLVTWFCYQLIAKPGNKTAAPPWPNPYHNFPISAGRIHARRESSKKLIFLDIRGETVQIQIMANQKWVEQSIHWGLDKMATFLQTFFPRHFLKYELLYLIFIEVFSESALHNMIWHPMGNKPLPDPM